MEDRVKAIKKCFGIGEDDGRTHWANCWKDHPRCSIAYLFAVVKAADGLAEAAIEYTTERNYWNRVEAQKDQDHLEGILIHRIAAYREARHAS